MNNLPEKDVYINLLKAAGFSDIQVGLTRSFYLSNSELVIVVKERRRQMLTQT